MQNIIFKIILRTIIKLFYELELFRVFNNSFFGLDVKNFPREENLNSRIWTPICLGADPLMQN